MPLPRLGSHRRPLYRAGTPFWQGRDPPAGGLHYVRGGGEALLCSRQASPPPGRRHTTATYPLPCLCRRAAHTEPRRAYQPGTERGATENLSFSTAGTYGPRRRAESSTRPPSSSWSAPRSSCARRALDVCSTCARRARAVCYDSTGVAPPWQCVAAMRRSPAEVKLPRSWPRCLRSTSGGALGYAPACRSTAAFGGGSPSLCWPSVLVAGPLVQCAMAAQALRRLGSASRRCAGRLSK